MRVSANALCLVLHKGKRPTNSTAPTKIVFVWSHYAFLRSRLEVGVKRNASGYPGTPVPTDRSFSPCFVSAPERAGNYIIHEKFAIAQQLITKEWSCMLDSAGPPSNPSHSRLVSVARLRNCFSLQPKSNVSRACYLAVTCSFISRPSVIMVSGALALYQVCLNGSSNLTRNPIHTDWSICVRTPALAFSGISWLSHVSSHLSLGSCLIRPSTNTFSIHLDIILLLTNQTFALRLK